MLHRPLKALSFSSLSRIFRNAKHHGRINCGKNGATSLAQLMPKRPRVIAERYIKKNVGTFLNCPC